MANSETKTRRERNGKIRNQKSKIREAMAATGAVWHSPWFQGKLRNSQGICRFEAAIKDRVQKHPLATPDRLRIIYWLDCSVLLLV
jgi:hypothetical protein